MLTTNTNFMDRTQVCHMASSIEKYILFVTKDNSIFHPIEKLPFEYKLLIDAIHIARISDNVIALTKLLNLIYYTIDKFPTESRMGIINYLVNDSFHFFFTHWSEILRSHYHHFIVYRATIGTVRAIFNNKLSRDEKNIYKQRQEKGFDLLEEDKKLINRIRESTRLLEMTKDHFDRVQRTKIELAIGEFRKLSKEAGDFYNKHKFDDAPTLEFYFDRYDTLSNDA